MASLSAHPALSHWLLSLTLHCISRGLSYKPGMLLSHSAPTYYASHGKNLYISCEHGDCPQLSLIVSRSQTTSVYGAPRASFHLTNCSNHGAYRWNSLPACCQTAQKLSSCQDLGDILLSSICTDKYFFALLLIGLSFHLPHGSAASLCLCIVSPLGINCFMAVYIFSI